MLNPNAKKWVAALRDPNTRQIKSALETSEGQCVLGVPCRLYADEHPEWPVKRSLGGTAFNGSYGVMPRIVQDWLGLATTVGKMDDGRFLMFLSDGGMSLLNLADLIEAEPEGLFV